MSSTTDLQHLDRLRRYCSRRPDLGILAAYLFGSHATGHAHRESDVDVALLLDWLRYPTRESRFDARITLGADLVAELHHNDVDVVILNDAPPLLGRQIVYNGLRAYVADPSADHAYVRDVQLRAADVALFLSRMRQVQLEALAR